MRAPRAVLPNALPHHRRSGMDPRVKPGDDDGREDFHHTHPPATAIAVPTPSGGCWFPSAIRAGDCRDPFHLVILGLDPGIHAGTHQAALSLSFPPLSLRVVE